MVPDELAFELDDLDVAAVQLADDRGCQRSSKRANFAARVTFSSMSESDCDELQPSTGAEIGSSARALAEDKGDLLDQPFLDLIEVVRPDAKQREAPSPRPSTTRLPRESLHGDPSRSGLVPPVAG